jgi:hypothetical protein
MSTIINKSSIDVSSPYKLEKNYRYNKSFVKCKMELLKFKFLFNKRSELHGKRADESKKRE